MPTYLFRVTLTADGLNGLLREGATARREVVERMLAGLGGRLESMYWAFGAEDVYVTAELPGSSAAAAIGLVSSASGGMRTNTTVLLTTEEMDEATRQRVDFRPPGA
jgi:uncharacterized protein with GYD domain